MTMWGAASNDEGLFLTNVSSTSNMLKFSDFGYSSDGVPFLLGRYSYFAFSEFDIFEHAQRALGVSPNAHHAMKALLAGMKHAREPTRPTGQLVVVTPTDVDAYTGHGCIPWAGHAKQRDRRAAFGGNLLGDRNAVAHVHTHWSNNPQTPTAQRLIDAMQHVVAMSDPQGIPYADLRGHHSASQLWIPSDEPQTVRIRTVAYTEGEPLCELAKMPFVELGHPSLQPSAVEDFITHLGELMDEGEFEQVVERTLPFLSMPHFPYIDVVLADYGAARQHLGQEEVAQGALQMLKSQFPGRYEFYCRVKHIDRITGRFAEWLPRDHQPAASIEDVSVPITSMFASHIDPKLVESFTTEMIRRDDRQRAARFGDDRNKPSPDGYYQLPGRTPEDFDW